VKLRIDNPLFLPYLKLTVKTTECFQAKIGKHGERFVTKSTLAEPEKLCSAAVGWHNSVKGSNSHFGKSAVKSTVRASQFCPSG
jgi:hypothetical protein